MVRVSEEDVTERVAAELAGREYPDVLPLADLADDAKSGRVLANVDALVSISLIQTSTWAQAGETRHVRKPDLRSACRALELGARVLGVLRAGERLDMTDGMTEPDVLEAARRALAKCSPAELKRAGIELAGLRVVGGGSGSKR
jgi:hypothetical protein